MLLGLSVSRNAPLGVRLSTGFCKLLLGEEPCFDDLKSEIPDEHAWMKDVKRAMDMARDQHKDSPSSAAASAAAAADAKLHPGDELCSRQLLTPSPKMQVWDCLAHLAAASAGVDDGLMAAFEQSCAGYSGRLRDDDATSDISCLCGVSKGSTLSGDNFEQCAVPSRCCTRCVNVNVWVRYVAGVVKKQYSINSQDILPHIYPAFQAAVRQTFPASVPHSYEIPPDGIRGLLGDMSGLELQAIIAGAGCSPRAACCCRADDVAGRSSRAQCR